LKIDESTTAGQPRGFGSPPGQIILTTVALTGALTLLGLDGGVWRVVRVVNAAVFILAVAWLLVALARNRRESAR
jgi:hypothetical protein